MKVCVLQPDYSTSSVDYQYYDPPRQLQHLLPGDQVDHVSLNKLTTYQQLKSLQHKGYDIFVNLCEGYLEWEVPSIDVVYTLELLHLPFTGPTTLLYDPPKELMKYVAYCEGVKTPAYFLIEGLSDIESAEQDILPLVALPNTRFGKGERRDIWEFVSKYPNSTIKDIATEINSSISEVRTRINSMVADLKLAPTTFDYTHFPQKSSIKAVNDQLHGTTYSVVARRLFERGINN